MAQGHGYLDGVETSPILWESCHLAKMHEQLATTNESHHEKDFSFGLEDVTHTNEEGMVRLKQDVFLKPCWLDLIILNDNILSQWLHRIDLLWASLLHEEHLTEGAATNDWLDHEIS